MIAQRFDTFFFDLDGVIYISSVLRPHTQTALQHLRTQGKTIRFLTNDPYPTRRQLAHHLTSLGVETSEDEIITCGWATARYLSEHQMNSIYAMGTNGLLDELQQAGLRVNEDERPDAVVIGHAPHISYTDIRTAIQLISNGARFIATNADHSFPTKDGRAPGTGALVEAIRIGSGVRPTVIGKPSKHMFYEAMQTVSSEDRIVMIGDNPATDILGAHQAGLTAILVVPELVSPPIFPSTRDFRTPDAIIADLSGLFDAHIPLRTWTPYSFPWPEALKPGVAAFVTNTQDQILVVQRADNGYWSLPSGHIELGESLEEAIIREIQEESGITVRVKQIVGVYSDPHSQVFTYPSDQTVQFITTFLSCEAVTGTLQWNPQEITNACFVEASQLPEPFFPIHRHWINDALQKQCKAFLR